MKSKVCLFSVTKVRPQEMSISITGDLHDQRLQIEGMKDRYVLSLSLSANYQLYLSLSL